jgi:peptidoglycan/xylan/chitin deacetylase (PgdA/CDA1 family)
MRELGSRLGTDTDKHFRRGSVILGYHGVGSSSVADDPYLLRVRPDRFRLHVEMLLAAGFQFVTMADFATRMNGDRGRPTGYAVVTFDDGMQDNREQALPILSEYGISATVYVLAGTIGRPNPWMRPPLGLRMMTASELRELAAAGWELGAHSVTHPHMSRLSYDACLKEMVDSRRTVEQLAGVAVRTFSYPFGSHGWTAMTAARAAGFTAAVGTVEGNDSRYSLRRAMIGGTDRFPVVVVKAAAVYQPPLSDPRATSARRRIARIRRLPADLLRRRALDAPPMPPVSVFDRTSDAGLRRQCP